MYRPILYVQTAGSAVGFIAHNGIVAIDVRLDPGMGVIIGHDPVFVDIGRHLPARFGPRGVGPADVHIRASLCLIGDINLAAACKLFSPAAYKALVLSAHRSAARNSWGSIDGSGLDSDESRGGFYGARTVAELAVDPAAFESLGDTGQGKIL